MDFSDLLTEDVVPSSSNADINDHQVFIPTVELKSTASRQSLVQPPSERSVFSSDLNFMDYDQGEEGEIRRNSSVSEPRTYLDQETESVYLEELADLLDESVTARTTSSSLNVSNTLSIGNHDSNASQRLPPSATQTLTNSSQVRLQFQHRNPLVVTQVSTSLSANSGMTSSTPGSPSGSAPGVPVSQLPRLHNIKTNDESEKYRNSLVSTARFPPRKSDIADAKTKPKLQKQRRRAGSNGKQELPPPKISTPSPVPSMVQRHSGPTPGATLAAVSALLKSWDVPEECLAPLAAESGFVFVVEPGKGQVNYVSENVFQVIGKTVTELQNHPIFNFLHPTDHPRLQGLFSNQNPVPTQSNELVTFTCAFLTSNGYENTRVTYVIVQKPEGLTPHVNTCRLVCVARKASSLPALSAIVNTNAVVESNNDVKMGLFVTKVDPTSFKVLVADIVPFNVGSRNGVNALGLLHASVAARTGTIVGRCLLDFCHPEDKNLLRNHFVDTLREKISTSFEYRMQGLMARPNGQKNVKIQMLSRYEKGGPVTCMPPFNNGNNHYPNHAINKDKGHVVSTHSVVLFSDNLPAPKTSSLSVSTSLSKMTQVQAQNPTLSSMLSPSAPSSKPEVDMLKGNSEAKQKNILLKQLLNVNFRRGENQPTSSNSRILQLLSQHNEGGSCVDRSAGLKRPSEDDVSSPSAAKQRPKATSSVCSDNPSLASLLSKPTVPSITVPPPVPTIWHQEPKERLPKDVMRKFLTPHPAERARVAAASLPSGAKATSPPPLKLLLPTVAPSTSPLPNNSQFRSGAMPSRSPPTRLPDLGLDTDPMLSAILDDVIEFQEKSPPLVGGRHKPTSRLSSGGPAAASLVEHSQISDIEQFLSCSTDSMTVPGLGNHLELTKSVVTSAARNSLRSIASTVIGLNNPSSPKFTTPPSLSVSSVASSNPKLTSILSAPLVPARSTQGITTNNNVKTIVTSSSDNLRQPCLSDPVSLVPRMNELLQVVPPNVSIPDCPDLVSLMHIQQNEEMNRRRRMSSGGSVASWGSQPPSNPHFSGHAVSRSSQVASPPRSNVSADFHFQQATSHVGQPRLQTRRASYSEAAGPSTSNSPQLQGLLMQQPPPQQQQQFVQQHQQLQFGGGGSSGAVGTGNRRRSSGGGGRFVGNANAEYTNSANSLLAATNRKRQLSGTPIVSARGPVINSRILTVHSSSLGAMSGSVNSSQTSVVGAHSQSLLQKLLSEK